MLSTLIQLSKAREDFNTARQRPALSQTTVFIVPSQRLEATSCQPVASTTSSGTSGKQSTGRIVAFVEVNQVSTRVEDDPMLIKESCARALGSQSSSF